MTYDKGNSFSEPYTYVMLGCLPINLFVQVVLLNHSFALFPQLEVVPIFQSSVMLWNIIQGGIFFNEFENFDSHSLTVFLIGTLTCVAGMMVMMYYDAR